MMMEVGNDEFCIKCMEWREYNDKGRCRICNSMIHKLKKSEIQRNSFNDYYIESTSFESEENNIEE